MHRAPNRNQGALVLGPHLRTAGLYDDTVFIVLSDNGPEFNAPTRTPGFTRWLEHVGYSQDVEHLGERGTYAFIGPEFASAAASPFAFFKLYAGEGGVRVPLIVAGPPALLCCHMHLHPSTTTAVRHKCHSEGRPRPEESRLRQRETLLEYPQSLS